MSASLVFASIMAIGSVCNLVLAALEFRAGRDASWRHASVMSFLCIITMFLVLKP